MAEFEVKQNQIQYGHEVRGHHLGGEAGNEVLTPIDGWPGLTVELAGKEKLARPAVLEVLE